MERLQDDSWHIYRLTPVEFPISDNDRKATYDQFMSLRDTLVYSNKFYWENAGRSLIIWMKTDGNPTNTIEIWSPNLTRASFESDWTVSWVSIWKYTSSWGHPSNPISCEINTTWRYVIQHKEQFNNIDSGITRIYAHVIQHHWNQTIDRAVFDWEWNTPWEITRLTSFWYVECDLEKWDWLELKMEDQNGNDITSAIASNSNWRIVEYKDLAYNV